MVTSELTNHSTYRESVLEHLFIGEVMTYCWRERLPRIEILKSQVDNAGYDVVLEANGIMRHVQLKSWHVGAATPGVNINVELANKPSGCVVWMFVDPGTLESSHFLWFGEGPGESLASLDTFKTSTHNKRNAQGVKTERPSNRYVTRRFFTLLPMIEAVVVKLFGRLPVNDDTDNLPIRQGEASPTDRLSDHLLDSRT